MRQTSRESGGSVLLAAAAAAALPAAACLWVYDPESLTTGRDAGGADAAPSGSEAGKGGLGDAGQGDATPLACPENMVLVPAGLEGDPFCIDWIETRQTDYAAFVAAMGGARFAGLPAACGAKTTSHDPTESCGDPARAYDPANRGKDPVGCLDWCDAYAYCAWAGKRLCGGKSGAAVVAKDKFDDWTPAVDQSEWARACSANGARAYPYGPSFVPGTCNGGGVSSGITPAPTRSCEGGYPGLFDMSGNAPEWENACDDATSFCLRRGGAAGSLKPEDLKCAALPSPTTQGRLVRYPETGVRCCKAP